MILKQSIPLKKHCNYKIGGVADYFFEFKNPEELRLALTEYKDIDSTLKTVFILGKGTNVLFADDGYRGLVLKNSYDFIAREGEMVRVGSGALMAELVTFATQSSLSGFEWAGGLPGTVGGAIRGNAGAFGGETKDSLVEVESIEDRGLKTRRRTNQECKFDYRQSVFKRGDGEDEIILSAKFQLKKGIQKNIKDSTQEKIDYRIDRHPLNYPNIGSTFKNIPIENVPKDVLREFEASVKQDPFPVLPVAKLIASAGLMGKTVGGAQISTKHPNFIVNIGSAKAGDVLDIIDIVKREIKERYGVRLEEEIRIV